MKGNPIIRLILVLILLTVVFWPVFQIAHRTPDAHQAPQVANLPPATTKSPISSSLHATILLHAAPSPLHCSITQNGNHLLSEKDLVSPGEYRSAVEITKGEDLIITAEWKNEEPHAVRAEVLVHGYQVPLEKSFWAQQTLEDTLPIPESLLIDSHPDPND